MVSPEHPLLEKLTTPDNKAAVDAYVKKCAPPLPPAALGPSAPALAGAFGRTLAWDANDRNCHISTITRIA